MNFHAQGLSSSLIGINVADFSSEIDLNFHSLYIKVGTPHENIIIQSISVFLILADTKFLHSIPEILLPKLGNITNTKSFFLNEKIK